MGNRLRGFLSRLFAPKPVPTEPNVELVELCSVAAQYEQLRAERLAQGPLDTTNAFKALRVVYTRAQRMKLLRGGKI